MDTSQAAGFVVGQLAEHLKANKSLRDFFGDFTTATVEWIRPLFLQDDDEPTPLAERLQAAPSDDLNQTDAQTAILRAVREQPEGEALLQSLVQALQQASSGQSFNIHNAGAKIGQQNINSKVDNTGTIFDLCPLCPTSIMKAPPFNSRT